MTEDFAVARLSADAHLPAEIAVAIHAPADLFSVTRTQDETSIVAPQSVLEGMPSVEPGWAALKVQGPLDFGLKGILASLATALAEADVSIFALSTFDTDYLLIKRVDLDRAIAALRTAGHVVET